MRLIVIVLIAAACACANSSTKSGTDDKEMAGDQETVATRGEKVREAMKDAEPVTDQASSRPSDRAAATESSAVFPVMIGATLTFHSAEFSDTWTTQFTASGGLVHYTPHHDVLSYVAKGGMRVDADGLYIVGETLADLGDAPQPPVQAIAFPMKIGATRNVPGLFPSTYTVEALEKITVPAGTYRAWRIAITDSANPPGSVWIAPGVGIVQTKLPTGRIDQLSKIEPHPE